MLVVFSSSATESVMMFQDIAVQLLKLMGATGRIPGALNAPDVPAALAQLESAVERIKSEAHAETAAPPADNEDRASGEAAPDEDKESDRQPPVAIAVRAVPLLSLLKRAAAADAEVVWEGKK